MRYKLIDRRVGEIEDEDGVNAGLHEANSCPDRD